MQAFHECELKLKIDNHEIEDSLRHCLCKTGFEKTDFRTETDCVLDTADNAFGNMLFRLRKITRDSSESLLFTVKIKGSSASFQDNMELEIAPETYNINDANVIIEAIQKKTGITIPTEVFAMKDRENIFLELEKIGICVQRTTQKKREEFTGNIAKATFDIFPDPVGTYFEIESDSEEKLYETIRMLNLENCPLEKRNYGQIVREATKGVKDFVFE